jgi:hypothetical protein
MGFTRRFLPSHPHTELVYLVAVQGRVAYTAAAGVVQWRV